MLSLPNAILDAINTHAEETFPAECCGFLLGSTDGSNRVVVEALRATNLRAEERNDRYEIDPAERKAAEEKAAANGLAFIGFYHSHPEHDAYFSETDLQNSEEYQWGEPWIPPTYSYLVVSIHGGKRDHHNSYYIEEGAAVKEDVHLSA